MTAQEYFAALVAEQEAERGDSGSKDLERTEDDFPQSFDSFRDEQENHNER